MRLGPSLAALVGRHYHRSIRSGTHPLRTDSCPYFFVVSAYYSASSHSPHFPSPSRHRSGSVMASVAPVDKSRIGLCGLAVMGQVRATGRDAATGDLREGGRQTVFARGPAPAPSPAPFARSALERKRSSTRSIGRSPREVAWGVGRERRRNLGIWNWSPLVPAFRLPLLHFQSTDCCR